MVKYKKTTSDVFSALSDDTRFDIMRRLKQHGSLLVGEIASPYQMSLPGVSKHLRVLEKAKLVNVRQTGRERHYEPNPETLESFMNFLEDSGLFWVGAIERMVQHVDKKNS